MKSEHVYTKPDKRPLWQRVFDAVCEDIESGKYRSGDSFFTVKELCREFDVSNITGRRVFQELKTGNYISTDGRRGTVVTGGSEKQQVFLCLRDELLADGQSQVNASQIYYSIMEGFKSNGLGDLYEIVPLSINFLISHSEEFRDANIIVTSECVLDVDGEADVTRINTDLVALLRERFNPVLFRSFQKIEGVSQVVTDYRKGFRDMVSFLFGKGYRKLGFFCGKTSSPWYCSRFQGFIDGLHENGLDFNPGFHKVTSGYDPREDKNAIRELMYAPSKPDAIVCANDSRALAILEFCSENQISVPGDLAVTGFDNLFETHYSRPKLTTLDPLIAEHSREALMVFRKRSQGRIKDPVTIRIEPALVVRDST